MLILNRRENQQNEKNNMPLGQVNMDQVTRPPEISQSADTLTLTRDNYVHFLPADCCFATQKSIALSDLDFVRAETLRKCTPKKSHVIIS